MNDDRMRYLITTAVLFAFSFGATYWITSAIKEPRSPDSLVHCFDATQNVAYAGACMRERIRELLANHPTKELMEFISAPSSPEQIRDQCHPIGHLIGEETFKRTGSLEQALALCSSLCRSACIHGAISAGVLEDLGEVYAEDDIVHAGVRTLTNVGSRYCERGDALCHGMGHVAFMASNHELTPALEVCDDISSGFKEEACYQGVFMERTGTTDAETPFLNDLKFELRDDYTYPCLDVAHPYRHSCFQFLGEYQLLLTEEKGRSTDPEALLSVAIDTCAALQGPDRSYCFEGIGVQSRLFGFDTFDGRELQPLCDRLPEPEDRASCTLGVVPKYFFIDRSGSYYCAAIGEADRRRLCYEAVFHWIEINSGPLSRDALTRICGDLPQCPAEYDAYQKVKDTLPDYRFGLFGTI